MGRGLPRRVAAGPSSGRRASISRTYGREPVDSPILHRLQKVSEREESEDTNFLAGFWLLRLLVRNEAKNKKSIYTVDLGHHKRGHTFPGRRGLSAGLGLGTQLDLAGCGTR